MSGEFKELLLQDYKYRVEAMGKSEAAGETRVNLFITLITLSAGAMGALVTKSALSAGELRAIVAVAFLSLLLIGLVTFMRMILRNKNTDICKHQLDMIRRTYQDHYDDDGSWADYDLFPSAKRRKENKDEEEREKDSKKNGATDGRNDSEKGVRVRPRQFGGLPHTVAALNGLLCAGAFAAISFPFFVDCLELLVVLTPLVVAGAFASQIRYLSSRERQSEEEMKRDFPEDTHAGGVVYRMDDGEAKYLLVSDKKGKKPIALLPKGHVKPGEGHAEAALREVCEEAGVVARLHGLIGRICFEVPGSATQAEPGQSPPTKPGQPPPIVSVKFFLMERLCEMPRRDTERKHDWMTYDRAQKELPQESREILRKAEELRLRKLHAAKPTEPADADKSG